MTYYHALTLGERSGRHGRTIFPREARHAARHGPPSSYEDWRSTVSPGSNDLRIIPSADFLGELRQAEVGGGARRPWFVLGEPGAGKSTLLKHWLASWAKGAGAPRLDMPLAVLIRLRELTLDDLDGHSEAVAVRLWTDHGARAGIATFAGGAVEDAYRIRNVFTFRPVWLLDGLDEFRGDLRDGGVLERLTALPGAKVASCRTAVFRSLMRDAAARVERELEIMPLNPEEQQGFLAALHQAAGRPAQLAAERHREVLGNAALRPLAGNPLLLSLIAELPRASRCLARARLSTARRWRRCGAGSWTAQQRGALSGSGTKPSARRQGAWGWRASRRTWRGSRTHAGRPRASPRVSSRRGLSRRALCRSSGIARLSPSAT